LIPYSVIADLDSVIHREAQNMLTMRGVINKENLYTHTYK